MKITENQIAAPFATSDIFGNPVSLESLNGKKVLLSFYRYASCPLCNLRMHYFLEKYPAYEQQGLKTLAFFQSPAEKIRQYVVKEHSFPFPIIADPDHTIYNQYQLQSSTWGYIRGVFSRRMATANKMGLIINDPDGIRTLLPADFLVSPDQTIHTAYYGKDIGDHIPFEQIENFLRE